MPLNDPAPGEIYQELLKKLRQAGADPVAQDIERTVARGIVLAEQQTELYLSSSVYRPMEESEALAVAIEFLVTDLEVPPMLKSTQRIIGGDSIEWRPERPGSEREDVALGPIGEVDHQALRQFLMKILEIAHELGIELPEVA